MADQTKYALSIADYQLIANAFLEEIASTLSSGSISVSAVIAQATTSVVTSVAASVSSIQILAANSGRLQATFFNNSTANCFLKLGTTASTSSFTVKIDPNGYYELPFPGYTGRIDAIWDAANGALLVTELS